MNLKTKIHIFSTVLMLLILLVTSIGVFTVYKNMVYTTAYNELTKNSKEIITSLTQTSEINDPETILRAYLPAASVIKVVDKNGKELLKVQSTTGIENLKSEEINMYDIAKYEDDTIMLMETKAIWTDGSVVTLEFKQRLHEITANLNTLSLILLGVIITGFILIILSSITLSKIVLKPIKRLNETMKKNSHSQGFVQIDVSENSNDELGELSLTFNEMILHMQQNYNKQHDFVSNASHELRTPLTVIESYTKLLHRRGFANKEITQEALDAILSESQRMKILIEQMLELAKNNEGSLAKIEEINMTELVQNIKQKSELTYNREIHIISDGNLIIHTDQQKMNQLLYIFIENAKKYSQKPIEIHVRSQQYEIEIRDYGEGIAEEDLPHLFDRFYRVNKDRNRKTGGTGLGLAIAKTIAEKLNIKINLVSKVNEGTRVILNFSEDVYEK